jgi:hypothetical protein
MLSLVNFLKLNKNRRFRSTGLEVSEEKRRNLFENSLRWMDGRQTTTDAK